MFKSNGEDGVDRAYLYDKNGNQTLVMQSQVDRIRDGTWDVKTLLTSVSVWKTVFVYDQRNHKVNEISADVSYGYTNNNLRATGLDNQWSLSVDMENRPILQKKTTYNAFGEKRSETISFNSDGSGNVRWFEYNNLGLLTKITDPGVRVRSLSVDGSGQTSQYDSGASLLSLSTKYTYTLSGLNSSEQDKWGTVTTRLWNVGRRQQVAKEFHAKYVSSAAGLVDTLGFYGVRRYIYDAYGNKRMEIDELNKINGVTH